MRFNLLPAPMFLNQIGVLEERILAAADLVNADTFLDFADKVAIAALNRAFRAARADEGTIWLADRTEEVLTPVYNNGVRAEEWVGKFRQPMGTGIISMVFAAEQPFCENDVWRNSTQDPALDQRLAVQTESMIAVPFYFARECRGVISCVKLAPPGEVKANLEGFTMECMREISLAAAVLSSLFDYRLLSGVLGWERF
jgi:hypothetical protein